MSSVFICFLKLFFLYKFFYNAQYKAGDLPLCYISTWKSWLKENAEKKYFTESKFPRERKLSLFVMILNL